MGKTNDLTAFDRGQIVGTRRMGHSISEVVQALGFSRATVSRVYREYIDSGKTIPARANCRGQQRVEER
ncbi:helix-turn-helix domain-containing protein [Salmonella enterica subsp. enterica serovar Derby]|nr:helix-turn-helix domain-containing protein [Salmonella enterica subsp. enterica serovar Derby]